MGLGLALAISEWSQLGSKMSGILGIFQFGTVYKWHTP